MRIHYELERLIGSPYNKGDIAFSKNGSLLLSPTGNRITIHDIKNDTSIVLPFAAKNDIIHLAISPDGREALAITDSNQGLYINLVNNVVLYRVAINRPVSHVIFNSNGKYIAVVIADGTVQLYSVSDANSLKLNGLVMVYQFALSGQLTHAEFSCDSKLLAVCSAAGSTTVIPAEPENPIANVHGVSLCGHKNKSVIRAYFTDTRSYDLITLDNHGGLVYWCSSVGPKDLQRLRKNRHQPPSNEEKETTVKMLKYTKKGRTLLLDKDMRNIHGTNMIISAAAYCPLNEESFGVLATMYERGILLVHELHKNEETPILLLDVAVTSDPESVSNWTCNISADGEWLAVGSDRHLLAVIEWRSESFVYRQSGHKYCPSTVAYSPNAMHIASAGGVDGEVKIWDAVGNRCIVTFNDHKSAVSAICWAQSGRAIISASHDGTVRASDIGRAKCFRTLVCDRPAQFSCVAVDYSSELVAAGARDQFEIFTWSLDNGQLLNVIAQHSSPVTQVAFHPIEPLLASTAFADKMLLVTNILDNNMHRTTLQRPGLDCKFSPDGSQVLVLTEGSLVSIFDSDSLDGIAEIDAHLDLRSGRKHDDVITADKSQKAKSFTTMSISPDGECMLLAGESTRINLYSIKYCALLTTFIVSTNRSLDAVSSELDWIRIRRERNAGVQLSDADDSGDDWNQAANKKKHLPGVTKGDQSKRSTRPELRVNCVHFSPTGTSWAAACSEGIHIYSTQPANIVDTFMPIELTEEMCPTSVNQLLHDGDHLLALEHALALNIDQLIRRVLHAAACYCPMNESPFIAPGALATMCASLRESKVVQLLDWISRRNRTDDRQYMHLYIHILHALVMSHGTKLKTMPRIVPTLTACMRSLQQMTELVSQFAEDNEAKINYIESQFYLETMKKEEVDT